MKLYLALPLLLLGGCVAAQFHSTGQPADSVIADNHVCAHAWDQVNRQYAGGAGILPVVGGAGVGIALAGAELFSPQYADAAKDYDACMAQAGWARN